MNYQEALAYLLSFTDYERSTASLYSAANFNLGRMEALLERLDNPHLAAKTVHLAGTKGKGSTAKIIASVLQAAGYRTGLFTSPHLHTFRERISIDGQLISPEEVPPLVERLRPLVDEVHAQEALGKLTTFELLTALAFQHFAAKGVDFQVLETGMGGRLDATNVVVPLLCVITSISLDHTAILGHTIAQIAAEKAGIIKENSLVVVAPQTEEADQVIIKVSQERGATLLRVGRDVTWQSLGRDLEGQSFRAKGRLGEYELWIPLLGEHQLENAVTALAALEALSLQGIKIPSDSIAAGMAGARWPGRLEILRRRPLLVVDGAHNPDSARRLKLALLDLFDSQRLILIMGASSDKDISGMICELAPISHTVIVTRSRHPRSAEPTLLATEFARQGVMAHTTRDVVSALEEASSLAGEKDVICATGSLFLVAEVIELARPERLPPGGPEDRSMP